MAEMARKWWAEYAWVAVVLTVVSLVGGAFMYMGATFATVREADKIDHQILMIEDTLKDVSQNSVNMKTLLMVLNGNMTDKFTSIENRLDRIDSRLSRIEGFRMTEGGAKE